MPFAKWYLEPVFVSRTLPWCTPAPGATNTSNNNVQPLLLLDSHHDDEDNGGEQNDAAASKCHSFSAITDDGGDDKIIEENGFPSRRKKINIDNTEQVLMMIHNRTMVNVIRQMANLLTAADQMFTELTEECRRLMERSGTVRQRMVKLSSNIERLNHQMRHSAPKIGNIVDYMPVMGFSSDVRWKSERRFDRELFTPTSRPLAVRELYSRAHAPGDVRLSGSTADAFGPRRNPPSDRTKKPPPTTKPLIDLCQCHCGRCHHDRQSSDGIKNQTQTPQIKILTNGQESKKEYDANHDHDDGSICECFTATNDSTSSSSSMVTWSSVTSSTAFAMATDSITTGTTTNPGQTKPKARIQPMSSFSSSGDYYVSNMPGGNGTKTIDDFFRKNNVTDQKNPSQPPASSTSVCKCSCQPDTIMAASWQTGSSSTATTINHQQQNNQQQRPDYWYWWWTSEDNKNNNDHRRWSSSAFSTVERFKPSTLDEMTIWLRENIETRRPESIVFKSASETPEDVLLERALSPPCSSHKITLRKKIRNADDDNDDSAVVTDSELFREQPPPRLKRRWSMMLIRRLSKRFSTSIRSNNPSNRVVSFHGGDPRLLRYRNELESNHLLNDDIIDYDDDVSSQENNDENSPVVLMSPEEREKLIADRFAQFTVVPIDVSGRTFHRMSTTRRSLIHTDFHIPRRKIPGRRSRSKSPRHPRTPAAVTSAVPKATEISPYAIGAMNTTERRRLVTERGCQTEDGSNNNNNRILVPIEVHRNDNTGDEFNDRFIQEFDDDEYVVILKKPSSIPPVIHSHRKRIDDTTSSNASIDVAWRAKTVMAPNDTTGGPGVATSPGTVNVNSIRSHQKTTGKTTGKQNGARSSSGNWSAATSDLVRSSTSSSSSPPPVLVTGGGGNLSRRSKMNPPPVSVTKMDGTPNATASHNEEAESVYSVDNDGYYTSMHTDSGLFFSHSLPPAVSHHHHQRSTSTTTFSTVASAKRQLIHANSANNNTDKQLKKKKKKSSPSDEQYRLSFLSRWKRFGNHSTPNNNQSKPFASREKQSVSASGNPEPSIQHYGSNVSINSILSNSDAATSTMNDRAETTTTAASSVLDFDCSVSRCSHQQNKHSASQSEKPTTIKSTATTNNNRNRIRSASGTYDDDSSSETLHTNDYEDEDDVPEPEKTSTITSDARSSRRTITESQSSSNSSSCRKLPPPPPPPRVSSMLQTLQKYRSGDDAASSSASEPISTRTTAGETSVATVDSETNSEYLLLHMHEERRRRLFLDIDTNRSYPPLSYINDGADTSVSIPSSNVCLDTDDNTKTSKTAASSGSRTITPVPSEPDGDDQLSNSVINLDTASANNNNNNKKLEERHLSSPLPTPKLDSFTVVNRSPKLRSKSSSSSCADSQKLSSTSSLSSSTVKAQSSPESKPKPKPRNSLIFNNSSNGSSTFSTSTCGTSPDSTATVKQLPEELSPKKSSQPRNQRRLTTEDLFIILHNSKKRHNIKIEPALFPANRQLSSPNSTASSISPRSPPGSSKSFSPVSGTANPNNNGNNQQPTHGNLKRRSWNEPSLSSPPNRNSPTTGARNRTSLALDRLGPVRPTTLTDFKRLLAQVRLPSPNSNTVAAASILNSSGSSPTSSSVSSSSARIRNATGSPSNLLSPSPSSGVSSTIASPLSPSPERNQSVTNNNSSMANFLKKFPKSKYPGESGGGVRSPATVAAAPSVASCPPIPEDDSVCTTTDTGVKHNCTSTWV